MTEMDARTEVWFRQGFRQFNRFMLLMWRLGLGKWVNAWPKGGGRIMVITHTGRKTGMRRRTPVNYAVVDGELTCTAALGRKADWYRNIVANSQVEVWLPDGWWAGTAEDVTDSDAATSLMRQVLINSGFAARMAGIDPMLMSDDELEEATASYRLLRISRTEARTGPGGPGELSWVWPLATMVLLPLALLRRDRKRS